MRLAQRASNEEFEINFEPRPRRLQAFAGERLIKQPPAGMLETLRPCCRDQSMSNRFDELK